MNAMAKRTVMRSSKGTKLYAVRDKEGKFKDIQTYKRAHGQDLKRKSAAETAAKKTAKKKTAKKKAKKAAKKK
jgi:DNA-binding protein HU-beta